MSETVTGHPISMTEAARLETVLLSKAVGSPYPPCPECGDQPQGVIRRDGGATRLVVESATRWEFLGCGHTSVVDYSTHPEWDALIAADDPSVRLYELALRGRLWQR